MITVSCYLAKDTKQNLYYLLLQEPTGKKFNGMIYHSLWADNFKNAKQKASEFLNSYLTNEYTYIFEN